MIDRSDASPATGRTSNWTERGPDRFCARIILVTVRGNPWNRRGDGPAGSPDGTRGFPETARPLETIQLPFMPRNYRGHAENDRG